MALHKLVCEIQKTPLTSSFNIVYVIGFFDRAKWVARVPGNGVESFGNLEAGLFLPNIHAISLTRACTSIPIPEIFTWEAKNDNSVKVPCRLETFVEGLQLSELWSGPTRGTKQRGNRP